MLSFVAGEGANRQAGRCTMQLATSFDTLPELPPNVSGEALPDGASVPFPIDKMLAGWLAARDAGVAAAQGQLGAGRCAPLSRPRVAVHTGWLRSDRDVVTGEITFWTGPGVDQRLIMEALAQAAHAKVDPLEELELEVEVVQERPAFHGAETAGELLGIGKDALVDAGLAPVVSGGRYTSDAGQLALDGIPTLVFGPGRGLGDMYQDDERVPLTHLTAAYRFYESFIERYCC